MRKLLMCPPHYYNVAYHLQNAHMKMSREVLHNKAQQQWINLYNLLTILISPVGILITHSIGVADDASFGDQMTLFGATGKIQRDSSAALTRPVLARISSAASGFFFCGIIEEPVTKESGSKIKSNSIDPQRISSSANLLKCTMVMAESDKNSKTKSLSETASILFLIGVLKPSVLAV